MAKPNREIYPIPDWMRAFFPLFQNTGGNDVEELLHDDETSMFANCVRYALIVAARSQYSLLMRMREEGTLKEDILDDCEDHRSY